MATKINLILEQGASFYQEIDLTNDIGDPLPVPNYIPNAQMRKSYQSVNAIPLGVDLQTGKLILSMNSFTTSQITPGRYVYDVVLSSSVSIEVDRLIEGVVTVTPAATR